MTDGRGPRLHPHGLRQGDSGDLAGTGIDLPALGLEPGTDRHGLADQAGTDKMAMALPPDGTMDGDGPDHIVRAVGDGKHGFWEGTGAGLVAAGGNGVGQGGMRAPRAPAT